MVAVVNLLPAVKRNERKETGQVAGQNMQSSGVKKCPVATLMQQDEPLHERKREYDLAARPKRRGGMAGQPESERRQHHAASHKGKPRNIGWLEAVQLRWMWRPR